jgi:membrane dipeptidase
MMRRSALLFLCLSSFCFAQTPTPQPAPALPPVAVSPKAMKLHRSAIVLDTHIDTTQRLMQADWDFFQRHAPPAPGAGFGPTAGNHVDYPRMREGGLNAAFFSIYMAGTVKGTEAVARALAQIDRVHSLVEQNPDKLALCTTATEVRRAVKHGKVAVLMGVEGGHILGNDRAVLRNYARLGVRYLTLSHGLNTEWSDSSSDKPLHNGLTDFGKEVVRELNRAGVMVDISHVSDKTFWDALEVSQAPMVASHSSVRVLSGHPRNMTDEMIKALAAKGGVIQINYLATYLSDELYRAGEAVRPQIDAKRTELENLYPGPENAQKRRSELAAFRAQFPMPAVSWDKIIEHIDHVVKLVGPRHVGLGSDFDGATMPQGMEDVTRLPKITDALLKKGYKAADIRGILGGNLLRVMEEVERVAARMQAEGLSKSAAAAKQATKKPLAADAR